MIDEGLCEFEFRMSSLTVFFKYRTIRVATILKIELFIYPQYKKPEAFNIGVQNKGGGGRPVHRLSCDRFITRYII